MAFLEGASSMGANQRVREPRQRTLIRASLFGDRMPMTDIIIRNVSIFGLSATSRGVIPERGEKVCIVLPDGADHSGEVRWVDGKVFGVLLDGTLNVRLLGVTTQRRNESFGDAIDWLVDQRFREEPAPDLSRLRRL